MAGELNADGTYDPTLPFVPIAGLLVPTPLVPRIVASLRGTYPTLTEGLTDEGAIVRAVLKHWVATTLVSFEGTLAGSGVDDAVEAARLEYRAKADAARRQAETDAATITDAPEPAPTEPTP